MGYEKGRMEYERSFHHEPRNAAATDDTRMALSIEFENRQRARENEQRWRYEESRDRFGEAKSRGKPLNIVLDPSHARLKVFQLIAIWSGFCSF